MVDLRPPSGGLEPLELAKRLIILQKITWLDEIGVGGAPEWVSKY
jgi:hypothetical protein